MKNVLILSPHTDDAELGCGGTIAKFIEDGYKIRWIVFSTAKESNSSYLSSSLDILETEFKDSMKKLSLEDYIIYDYKVRYLHEKRQEILEQLINQKIYFNPDLVIGPSLNDFHQDHQVIANEMIRAFKTSASIYCYELIWNHINFQTQLFVRLNERHLNKKIELLRCYGSQIFKNKSYFSEDFIRGLAISRGSQINCKYAEAFEVVRSII
jgi:LmbE family N-acetylglucosaminyl deacetylase